MEALCLLLFTGEKARKLLLCSEQSCLTSDEREGGEDIPSEKTRVEEIHASDGTCSKPDSKSIIDVGMEVAGESIHGNQSWVLFQDVKLYKSDKAISENGQLLNDLHIHFPNHLVLLLPSS